MEVFPNNSDEVIALAKKNHPEWRQLEIDAYVVGYFDSILDNRARQIYEQEGMRKLRLKQKKIKDKYA